MLALSQLIAPLTLILNLLGPPPALELSRPSRNSAPVDLDPLFNARAAIFSPLPGDADSFDGRGRSYPADAGCLPQGTWWDDGIEFDLPQTWASRKGDHILASNQTVMLDRPLEISALHLLVSGDFYDGDSQEAITIVFEDSTEQSLAFSVKDWWSLHWLNKAPIVCPYHYTPAGRNWNITHIHHAVVPLPPTITARNVTALRLPPARAVGQNRLHIFALSLAFPAPRSSNEDAARPALRIRTAQTKSRWTELPDGRKAQSIVLALENAASSSLISHPEAWLRSTLSISLTGLPVGFEVVRAGLVSRLMPGDGRDVEVLVAPVAGVFELVSDWQDWRGEIWVTGSYPDGRRVDLGRSRVVGPLVRDWKAFYRDPSANFAFHSSPAWFDEAKFGIFIHWGLFSVPAWTSRGRYAEWYQYWLHEDAEHKSDTWQHHLETYGADFKYDDFIPSFDGSKFDADEWARLIADSGAKYFVLTTKHHDGFALFDTGNSSGRSSVKLAPGGRDYTRELFDAADRQGGLKKGTYFSMPEWYNPDYTKYGWERFPGGFAPDVFHPGRVEAYTGWHKVDDYVEDLQLAQMRILGEMGTDIMWCDIGGANHSSSFLAEWYAGTSSTGRQVTTNNRCGIAPDFSTPEFERFATVQTQKWETCEGIDPFSFGFNRATKASDYRSSEELIHNLIDITSKNGNYLLNVGPTGEGEIIAVMQDRLRDVGRWLAVNGEAIYGTTPFPLLPELVDEKSGLDLRFTRTAEAFYIIALRLPVSPILRVPAQLPVLKGDRITLLGSRHGESLAWTYDGHRVLEIAIPPPARAKHQPAYVFRVALSF